VIKQLDAVYRGIRIIIDGEEFTPTNVNGKIVEPFLVGGTTYVPLRAIGEAFGKDVEWVGESSLIFIDSPRETWVKPDYVNAPPAPSKNVTVSTPQEFADAIGPNTCITLNAGVYDLSTVTATKSEYVFFGDETGELIIAYVDGLTIQPAPGAIVELVTPDRFSTVIVFMYCNGIKMSGIRAGHTVTGEYECDAGVVLIMDSANIKIEDCLFYGSGSYGLWLRLCVSAQIVNTTVTDCSLRAVDLFYSNDVTFTGCKFIDNRAYGSVIWGNNTTARFIDCEISGNKELLWNAVEINDDVLFERCVFKNNAISQGAAAVFAGYGIRLRDCEIEKAGFSGYWSSDAGVINLGGNKLN